MLLQDDSDSDLTVGINSDLQKTTLFCYTEMSDHCAGRHRVFRSGRVWRKVQAVR